MPNITASQTRRIIEDFKNDILTVKELDEPPRREVIDYKDDLTRDNKRDVHLVPLEYLRYRYDNSRLNAETETFQQLNRRLNENDADDQKLIGDWLVESDTDAMERLMNDMRINRQREVAIITCDGFLINGNRRKKAFELLSNENDADQRFRRMKVVILPSSNPVEFGEGGAPTYEDIQRIEYAYQVQESGRSEYTGINRALQYRKNINLGFSLETQLRKDPQYSNLTNSRKFTAVVNKIKKEYLNPLDEVDKYLEYFDRAGLYTNISKTGDASQGRWQAFIDWSNTFNTHLSSESSLLEMGLNRGGVGNIKEIAYKIIRQRELKEAGKVHQFMRDIPKFLKRNEIKSELNKITEDRVPRRLPTEKRVDEEGKSHDIRTLDNIWSGEYGNQIINITKKCRQWLDFGVTIERPKQLLEEALKKLNHEAMDPESVATKDNDECLRLCDEINDRVSELHTDFDHNRMKREQLSNKK